MRQFLEQWVRSIVAPDYARYLVQVSVLQQEVARLREEITKLQTSKDRELWWAQQYFELRKARGDSDASMG